MSIDDELKIGYSNINSAVCIVDTLFEVVWANNFALKAFPNLKLKDGIISLLPDYNIEEIIETLKNGKPVDVLASSRFAVLIDLSFTPFYEADGALKGAFVFISETENSSLSPSLKGSNKIIDSINYQFRNPLSVIFAILSLMDKKIEESNYSSFPEFTQRIWQSSCRMLRSTANFTEYLSGVSGEYKLDLKSCSLNSFLSRIVQISNEICNVEANITIDLKLPTENIESVIDPGKLTIALLQLISNACKFSYKKRKINVSLSKAGNHAIISVADYGIGVTPKTLSEMTKPYSSFENSEPSIKTMGLGLAIVKQIVLAHEGTIAFNSSPDEGLICAFNLPIKTDSKLSRYVFSPNNNLANDKLSNFNILLSDIGDN